MRHVIKNDDWKKIEYSEQFVNAYTKKVDEWTAKYQEQNPGTKRPEKLPISIDSEIKAKLLMEMQGNSFKELHDGVSVYLYDETKVHPIIQEEEYGGQNIIFEEGPSQRDTIDKEHVFTYDPTGEHNDYLDGKGTAYDKDSDTYNGKSTYKDGTAQYIKRYKIEGSRQWAEKLVEKIPKSEREYIDRYMNFSSSTLEGVKSLLSLKPEEREIYFKLYNGYRMTEDKKLHYARTLDKEALSSIHALNMMAIANHFSGVGREQCEKAWELITGSKDFLMDFFNNHDLHDGFMSTNDFKLLKYIPEVPGQALVNFRMIEWTEDTLNDLKNKEYKTEEELNRKLKYLGYEGSTRKEALADIQKTLDSINYKEIKKGVLEQCIKDRDELKSRHEYCGYYDDIARMMDSDEPELEDYEDIDSIEV